MSSGARDPSIDRLRGLGAWCVVLIHATPFLASSIPLLSAAGWTLLVLCQDAVPFFFVLSGYYLARRWKDQSRPTPPWRGTGRILSLYVPWFLVYLAFDAARGLPIDPILVLRRFASLSDGTAPTTGFHLWFLPSLVYAQWVVWGLARLSRSPWPAVALGAALHMALGALDLSGARLPFGLASHEFLGVALPATSLGAWIAMRSPRWSPGLWWLSGLAALQLAEALAWKLAGVGIPSFQILRPILPAALLLTVLTRSVSFGAVPDKVLDALGRESTGVYVAHLAFLILVPWEVLVPNGFVRHNLVIWAGGLSLAWITSRALASRPATSWLVR